MLFEPYTIIFRKRSVRIIRNLKKFFLILITQHVKKCLVSVPEFAIPGGHRHPTTNVFKQPSVIFFNLFILGLINSDPFVTQHVPVLVITHMGSKQNGNDTSIFALEINLIINTPTGRTAKSDEDLIRKTAIIQNIPCITSVSGAAAAVGGIDALRRREGITVKPLQEYYK